MFENALIHSDYPPSTFFKAAGQFKSVLLKTKNFKVTPWTTMNNKLKISQKDERENYYPYLPAKLQNFCLLHVNIRYNYNILLNKYKWDEQGDRIPNTCTFCKLINPDTTTRESIYTVCTSNLTVNNSLAARYNITLPII